MEPLNIRYKIFYLLLKIFLFLVFLKSLNAWFLWYVPTGIFYLAIIFLFIITQKQNKKIYTTSQRKYFYILIFTISIFLSYEITDYQHFATALSSIPVIAYLIFSSEELKIDILKSLSKYLASILLISLITYELILVGVNIPSLGIIVHPDGAFYRYNNFGIVLIGNYFPRFHSIFCEPGQTGMIISFLLFANQFKLKEWHNLVLFISLLATFSLSGFVLTLIGFILYSFSKNIKRASMYLSIFIIITGSSYVYFKELDNGDNYVNTWIIERSKYDKDTGNIQGNNRFTEGMDQYFSNLSTSDFLLGQGQEHYAQIMKRGINGAGYKVFIVVSGLIAICCIGYFYLLIAFKNIRNKRLALAFWLIFALAFLQRAYPFWSSWLIILICGAPQLNYSVSNIKNKTVRSPAKIPNK